MSSWSDGRTYHQSLQEKDAAIRTLLPLIFAHLECHQSLRRLVAHYYYALDCPLPAQTITDREMWEIVYARVRKRYRILDLNRALIRLFLEQQRLFWALYFQTIDSWPDWMRGEGETLFNAGVRRLAELMDGDVLGYEPRHDQLSPSQLRDREVRRMMCNGLTSRRITKDLGVDRKTVLESAKRMGLEWRTPGVRNKALV